LIDTLKLVGNAVDVHSIQPTEDTSWSYWCEACWWTLSKNTTTQLHSQTRASSNPALCTTGSRGYVAVSL